MAPGLASEAAHLRAEIRELEMLGDSTQTEITRLQHREDQSKTRYEAAKSAGGQALVTAADEYIASQGRRMTMESQLAALNAKRKLLDRVLVLIDGAATQVGAAPAPVPAPLAPPAPAQNARFDESKLLQAVVDTQEDERRRIARQVHDGPAQAMANVVLQSEISERLFDVDPQRSRQELAGLRLMVNKTLQELRGFIFELRPMILDDLGLVPTLRRYIQTLVDKHGVKIDFASNGRDRRLPSEEEVAIFRLIQDSLLERIERGEARDISLSTTWRDETLEIMLQSDGRELPADGELSSGLRRSERLELLKGQSKQEPRADGTALLQVQIPIKAPTPMIT